MTDRAALAAKLCWAYPRGPSHVTQEEWRVVLAALEAAPDREMLRPEVRRFAEAMEAALCAHDATRGGGWSGASRAWLFQRLKGEVGELRRAVFGDAPVERVAKEAADVGNFAMFLAEIARLTPRSEEEVKPDALP